MSHDICVQLIIIFTSRIHGHPSFPFISWTGSTLLYAPNAHVCLIDYECIKQLAATQFVFVTLLYSDILCSVTDFNFFNNFTFFFVFALNVVMHLNSV